MDFELDRGIAVTPAGPGAYDVVLDPGWVVGGGVNGGYALAAARQRRPRRAGRARDPGPDQPECLLPQPHPPRPGPGAGASAAHGWPPLHRGRQPGPGAGRQPGRADHRARDVRRPRRPAADVQRQIPPPELPPVEDCVEARFDSEEARRAAPLLDRFGTRLDPAYAGWAVGKPSGAGVIQGWFRLADERPLDPIALLLVVDALPPASFDLGLPGLGAHPASSPPTCEPGPRRAGPGCGTRPGTSRPASSRRTARCGTRPVAW